MREFKPKKIHEILSPGQEYADYYEYLTEYIIEYFKELAKEFRK